MRTKTIRFILILLLVSIMSSGSLYAKSKKNDEKRFQLGLGINISTSNIFGFIQSIRMTANEDYSSLGLTKAAEDELKNSGAYTLQTLMIANIFASMEYSVQLRMLAHMFIAEADLVFLPVDSAANGRFDMSVTVNAGLRAPYWLMPYLTVGANFTFSWYPGRVVDIENWRNTKGSNIFEKFAWSPGMNMKVGLDIKFKKFSVGVYYQYMIKDFNEFGSKFESIFMDYCNGDSGSAVAALIGSQSRLGASICWYLF